MSKPTPISLNMKLESTQVGIAGEYLVAAELTLRGYVAAITLRNTRGMDIIASTNDGSRSVSIQVKTSSGKKPKWVLTRKAESYFDDNHFYVFVALGNLDERPSYHIVPSKVVADYVATSHKAWLAGTKKGGAKRKDSSMRNFADPDHKYQDQWHTLFDN